MTTTPHLRNRITTASAVALLGALGVAVTIAASPALRGEPTAEDGAIPDDREVSVFDDAEPAVAKLDEDLLEALRAAATEAEDEGLRFRVNSGWRSPGLQERMLQDAVTTYGSRAEAARWVATAETSAHVSGQAVDIGPYDASDWLVRHGDDHGLCQIYANEPWHFELRPLAITEGCPQPYTDPTEDPRIRP
ncbi:MULTISPECIES: M15 family metallopeptidase [unclassified Saccharopolyspora]|uniref:M15 family metallopeptidase n=1 Tax=unclassified Saccharopolyspora TaxID=2646250 RepID=UPI001CD7158E|nr:MULTISPECIES: M15 family metallopeptidase [unclassified Saccharopolyspora]MCA1184880.1 M15 family metallopeptidase [Saccharopolyspora sp. 6T]MCA1226474.1 M15 family metallopeptidase [Saccharopolyspora sp. 6M]MCA1283072.1 M15 family metallopeptidase [Saccharopolyspora sp. 7B]